MAYQIIRKSRITEELELCRADGTVAERLTVDIDIDSIGARVYKAYENMAIAQLDLQKDKRNVEAFGRAVLNLFVVIFGEDGANRIAAFYENKEGEMLLDLIPFINNVVMPQVSAASAHRKQQLLEAAKASKQAKALRVPRVFK